MFIGKGDQYLVDALMHAQHLSILEITGWIISLGICCPSAWNARLANCYKLLQCWDPRHSKSAHLATYQGIWLATVVLLHLAISESGQQKRVGVDALWHHGPGMFRHIQSYITERNPLLLKLEMLIWLIWLSSFLQGIFFKETTKENRSVIYLFLWPHPPTSQWDNAIVFVTWGPILPCP